MERKEESRSVVTVGSAPPWGARDLVAPADAMVTMESKQHPGSMAIRLLGGFSVAIGARSIQEAEWPLRKVRALIKILALAPGHQLHREQVMDVLWPDLEPEAAANNLHKALHLARRVIERDLPPKTPSSFLHLQADFVSLQVPGPLWVDVEAFREAAFTARTRRDPFAYEEALALYTGDLLPGDRYEDFSVGPREELRSLQFQLLLELSAVRAQQGEIGAAMEPLRQVVAQDPAHEEAHAGLMRLLVRAGQRHLALRQYQYLTDALRRELDTEPDPGVKGLYEQIRTGAVVPETAPAVMPGPGTQPVVMPHEGSPLAGRNRELGELGGALNELTSGRGGLALVCGEAGTGKSRFIAELVQQAAKLGATTLWSAGYAQEHPLPYAPFVMALEGFAIRVAPAGLRALLGDSASELAHLAPAIATAMGSEGLEHRKEPADRRHLYRAMADFLRRLAIRTPVVFAMDDLQRADEMSLQLLVYLARTLRDVPVLFLGAYSSDKAEQVTPLIQLGLELNQEGIARTITLKPLDREATAQLVGATLEGPSEPQLVDAVQEIGGGIPFYTIEAVHALRGRGYLRRQGEGWALLEGIDLSREQLRSRPAS